VPDRDEDAKFARLLEQDSKKAREAHRRAMDAEFARLLEVDMKKAEAAEFARLLEEDRRKAEEAHRRATDQEKMQHEKEEESMERERLEEDSERREREAAESKVIAHLCIYEEKWAVLRSNVTVMENVSPFVMSWPSFEEIRGPDDITEERISDFI
jgi:hypothetical protein